MRCDLRFPAQQPLHKAACTLVLLWCCVAGHAQTPRLPTSSAVVRLTAGEGARVFGPSQSREDRRFLLGNVVDGRSVQAVSEWLAVETEPTGPVAALCCPGRAGPARLQCMTERSITLGAQAREVFARYGRPPARSRDRLDYPGIRFELGGAEGQQVLRICVVPR